MKTVLLIILTAVLSFSKSRLDLEVTGSGFSARVTWKVTPGTEKNAEVKLYRSYVNINVLETLDLDNYPITVMNVTDNFKDCSFIDSALAHGCTYYYYLSAAMGDGTIVPSNVAEVTIPGIDLPPSIGAAVSIFVDKLNYFLEVRHGNQTVKRYPVNLGGNPRERKLHYDRLTTPEGNYRIVYANLGSVFHKSFMLDYPNAEDKKRYSRALRDGKIPLVGEKTAHIGGDITIHGGGIGNNWTWGCIAMRNSDIDEMHLAKALENGTRVTICGTSLCPE